MKRLPRFLLWVWIACLAAAANDAGAQTRDVRIDIQSGQGRRVRVHCESLQAKGNRNARQTSVQADELLAMDLQNSAVFIVSRSWVAEEQGMDVQAIITGTWTVRGRNIELRGQVLDLPARRPIMVKEYQGTVQDWRVLVHQFADDVVLQFTGEPGVAQTRIAFITKGQGYKELAVMDYDGAGLFNLTNDRSIALSPAWSPDGSLLLFSSYRGGGSPQIYVVSSTGGRTFLVSGREGNNISPSYSPDGREIVCALSYEGNPEIYVTDARGKNPRRLTKNRAIDSSPAWSPTGQEIAFTSDRSGTPQVYLMDREGGNVRRLTYDVSYTDSPDWSPKGDRIAFVSRAGNGFDIYVCRPDGTGTQLVASGASNEDPHWSPDGRHLVFASDRDGRYGLYVTDLDGRPPRKLDTGGHEAISPAWSPRPESMRSALNMGEGP